MVDSRHPIIPNCETSCHLPSRTIFPVTLPRERMSSQSLCLSQHTHTLHILHLSFSSNCANFRVKKEKKCYCICIAFTWLNSPAICLLALCISSLINALFIPYDHFFFCGGIYCFCKLGICMLCVANIFPGLSSYFFNKHLKFLY